MGLLAGSANAQEDAAYVDYRQKLMGGIGADMAAIGDILKHGLPLTQNIAGHAAAIETHADQIAAAFEHRVTEGATDAKAEIWSDWDGFKKAIDKMRAEAGKMREIAPAGDMRAIGLQMRALGGSCGGCHEGFRKPKEESYKNK